MVKDLWHKLEEGEFDKNGNSYEYIIEQNKNLPLNEKNMRVRIIKSYPKVKSITTRYDPNVSIDGDDDCYVPSYWGYNPKLLKSISSNIFIIFMFIYFFLLILGIDLITIGIPSINIPQSLNSLLLYLVKIVMLIFILFGMLIPFLYRTILRLKLYFKLKKEGLEYNQITGG